MDAVAINKPCKLNYSVFYNVLSSEFAGGYQGFFSMNMACYRDFEVLVLVFTIS